MSRRPSSPGCAAIWEAIVARAEALHDAAILCQRRALSRTALQLEAMAADLCALSRAAALVEPSARKRKP